MRYREGKLGRVFVVKFEHGENFLEKLYELVEKENVQKGIIHFMGAMETADVVAGPKEPTIPEEVYNISIGDGREVIGLATISPLNGKPKIHLHASFGKDKESVLGCIRGNTKVFIVVEAVIMEIDVDAKRSLDEKTGKMLLEL